jgi:hypothetical protein
MTSCHYVRKFLHNNLLREKKNMELILIETREFWDGQLTAKLLGRLSHMEAELD